MFTLRQLAENKLEGQENMAMGCINLEKTYDIVPRDMATLRWVGVPGAEVRMVEDTYEETKGRVECGPGISEEFREDVGLRQGSALSPLLFIAVVEVISRKASTKDILRKLLYADVLTIVADSEADLQHRLVDWKEILGKHGLRVSLEKTEVLSVEQQNNYFDVRLGRNRTNETALYIWVERFVGTAARRRKFAGEYKLG